VGVLLGLSRQVQQALAFLLLVLVFGGGIMYARWQAKAEQGTAFVLEKGSEEAPVETKSQPEELKVHVAGAVKRPGVYSFQEKDRVEDVVALAEPLAEADLDALNLAAYLRDEQRIFVPFRQEEGASNNAGRSVSNGALREKGKPNLNTSGKEELMTLPGIGPALAERIISYRENQGPFRSVEDLKKVSGIGDKKFQELKDLVTY
jgi:competence protein ComEA